MNERRTRVALACGAAALVVVGALSPWIYSRVRSALLLARLETAEDREARAELAELHAASCAHERWIATRNETLSRNLVEMAKEGILTGTARRDVFEAEFPAAFTEDAAMAKASADGTERGSDAGSKVFVARAKSSLWQVVAANDWRKSTYRAQGPREGDGVEQLMEYFVTGVGSDPRLVYQRCSWVLFPAGARTLAERMRIENQDLTDIPDLLNLFPGNPRSEKAPGGSAAVELRFGSMGGWQQFIPGNAAFDRSISYELSLDGASPIRLGSVAVSSAVAEGRWFAEDATRGKPVEKLERGAHWLSFLIPESTMKLEPLQKVRIRFRPAPDFAERHGIKAPAADSPAYEREYYLPPWEKN